MVVLVRFVSGDGSRGLNEAARSAKLGTRANPPDKGAAWGFRKQRNSADGLPVQIKEIV